ncbi:MAG: hypothetical protein EZS28_036475, partial [Streblomastix strix]
FSGIANFGSKILGGVKKAAQWVAPALHKVLSTISGPVGMIHPAIGGALGAGANLAGALDRLYQKRSNSSGGIMSNEDAESGTVWMYDQNLYNSGDIVPDQVKPASDATPLIDSGTGIVGTSTEYSRGDHQLPLNITTTIPPQDSASGQVGTTNCYARNDHSHPLNITTTIPPQDSANVSVGTTNYYARNDHSHPINVETNASNIPVVNGVDANGSSAFYARQDHVHPQQLTYDGNVIATKFIKTGGTATEILYANGDTTAISTIDSDSVKKTGYQEQSIAGKLKRTDSTESFDDLTDDQYTIKYTIQGAFVKKRGKTLQYIEGVLRHSGDDEESEDDEDYITRGTIYNQYVTKAASDTIIGRKAFKNNQFEIQLTVGIPLHINWRGSSLSQQFPESKLVQNYVLNAGTPTSFAGVTAGNIQINPTSNNYDDGLRIGRPNSDGLSAIYLGCSSSASGTIAGQWSICTPNSGFTINPLGLLIQRCADVSTPNRGLQISADGNTLTFNGRVL